MSDFRLLKLPIGEDHIQNRIDNFCTELFPKMSDEQFHIVMDAAYDYLLTMAEVKEVKEANEEDATFTLNALARIAEAQFWIYQMQD